MTKHEMEEEQLQIVTGLGATKLVDSIIIQFLYLYFFQVLNMKKHDHKQPIQRETGK